MILVTGATGKIGSRLIPQLLTTGQPIRAFTRDARKLAQYQSQIEIVEGDFRDQTALQKAVTGMDKIFLLTTGFKQAAEAQSMILSAARSAGVRYIVKISTLQAGIPPLNATGEIHLQMEEEIRTSGLDYTFLRPTVFNTNTIWWFGRQIKAGNVVRFTGGTGLTSPVDPYDIASVAAVALTQPGHSGKVYNLTGPELLTFADMVHQIGRVIEKPLTYEDLPLENVLGNLSNMGLPSEGLKEIGEILDDIAGNRFATVSPDIERVTGRPAHSFAEWVCQVKGLFLP